MRQAIASLIEIARLSFNTKTPAIPAKRPILPARCTTSHMNPVPVKTRLKDPITMNTTFTRSPLADADDLSPRAIDAVLAVFSEHEVQRRAAEVRGKLLHVAEMAALRSEIASAVKTIGTHSNDGLSPAVVAELLRKRAAELDDMLEDARADRDAHEAARKKRLTQLQPLRIAVSTRVTTLMAERENCLRRIDSSRRASTLSGVGINRHANLVAVGLSAEQIASLGTGYASQEDQEAALRGRIAALDSDLAPLREFSMSGDIARLAGLGFDALIHALNAAEQVPA